jgi:Arc/MetJ-type ribon-helix-helix transcriptional regulator
MDTVQEIVLMIFIVAMAALTIYAELRIRKVGIGKKVSASRMKKDQAYNTLHTTKAVRNKLKIDRMDTLKADYMIQRAEDALDSGNWQSCDELCRKAREELLKSRRMGSTAAASKPSVLEEAVEESEPEDEPIPAPVRADAGGVGNTGKLQANFELKAAKSDLDRFAGDSADREKASQLMEEAERQFEANEFQKSLSCSFKARKVLSGEKIEEPLEKECPSPEEAKVKAALRCKKCGAPNEPEDAFCHACGSPLKLTKCPNCGAELKGFEKFCRKCGKAL